MNFEKIEPETEPETETKKTITISKQTGVFLLFILLGFLYYLFFIKKTNKPLFKSKKAERAEIFGQAFNYNIMTWDKKGVLKKL